MPRYTEGFAGSRPHLDEPYRSREAADARLAERIGIWTGLGWVLSGADDGSWRLAKDARATLVLRIED